MPQGPGAGAPPPDGGAQGAQGLVPDTPIGGNDPMAQQDAFMAQIRDLHTTIDALAQDHPEAAQDFEDAKNSLIAAMSKVAASLGSPDAQQQPPVV